MTSAFLAGVTLVVILLSDGSHCILNRECRHVILLTIDPDHGEPFMSQKIILTTSSHLEGYRVTEHIDIVSAECVFGMNIIKDMFAGVRDFFGGRNKSSQDALRDARVACLDELREEAAQMGANAVIGIDLDYSEISGGGKSMLFLVATGTAVKVAKA